MKKICSTCKKIFNKKSSDSKKYWKKRKYCSLKCSKTWFKKGHKQIGKGNRGRIGKDSFSYKGGRNTSIAGYIRILIPGTGSYKLEHRLIMEKYLGRKLKREEQVHHINGIKNDNRIKNLELMNIREHSRYETQKQWDNGSRR